GGFRRTRWSRILSDRQVRRIDFCERHPRLSPIPYMIIATLVGVLALSGGLSFANPSAKVYGYAISLVLIDVGMVFIAALFVVAGRPLWREDRDSTYLALALGFSGIPVWGLLEVFCLNPVLFSLFPSLCDARPGAVWVLVLWFVAVPAASILLEFWCFVRRGMRDSTRAEIMGNPAGL